MKYRRAYYLRKVGVQLLDGSITRSQAELVGWTKLQIIADGLTRRNAAPRLRLAGELPVHRLKEALASKDQSVSRHCVLMYFSSEQYEELSRALIKAGARKSPRGLSGKEEALMSIVKGWRHARARKAQTAT